MTDYGNRTFLTSTPIKTTWRDVVAAVAAGLVCGLLLAYAI